MGQWHRNLTRPLDGGLIQSVAEGTVFKRLLPCTCRTAANPNLHTSLLPRRPFDRMTRFSDPVVVESDLSAYSLVSLLPMDPGSGSEKD
jgi:hypothetical protein